MNKEKISVLGKSLLWSIFILLFPILSGVLSGILALETVEILFLQGIFMLLSLVLPLILILKGKWKWREIGFGKFDVNGCKKTLYFLPLLIIFVPVAVDGFYIKSTVYVLGNAFLYLAVGMAEEVYFRGIIPKYLGKAFSLKGVILFSAILFGIGHIATAFTANDGWEVFLTIINAFVFGLLAMEMAVIASNITPIILLHFLFDFETKIVVMSGKELLGAEGMRGAFMAAAAIWLAVVMYKEGRILRELKG